jgi:hypothetical protein
LISPSWIETTSTSAPRVFERLPRLLELDPLEHVGGEDRDLLAFQHVCHADPSSVSFRAAPTRRRETYA